MEKIEKLLCIIKVIKNISIHNRFFCVFFGMNAPRTTRILFLLLLLPALVVAQLRGWQELTISDGLSQGMIFDLKQDRKGFIWIATKDGLNRYDGYNFTVFTNDPYNEYSISDNNCSALLIDSRGRLWVGTLNHGLNLFDERTQRFWNIDISDQATPNAGNYEVQRLAEDPQGNIWVATDKSKMFKIVLPPHLKTHFPDKPNFTHQVQLLPLALPHPGTVSTTRSLYFEPGGRAIVGTTHGLYTLNWKRPTAAAPLPLADGSRFEAYTSYGARGWFAVSNQQLVCGRGGVLKTLSLPKKEYPGISLVALDKNTLAVATTNLLWLMSPEEFFAQDSLTAHNAYVVLPPNVYGVTDFLKDRTGNIWLGTSGYGVRKFNPKIKEFRAYLPATTLSYLLQDQQRRYYARHEFAYGELIKESNQLQPFLSNKLATADRRQRYMMQDRKGFFWVSHVNFETHAEHLYKFSPDWQLLKKYELPVSQAFGFMTNQTVEDREGQLWIGSTNGRLLRFNPETETFKVYSYGHLLPQSGAVIETYALYFDAMGSLWVGTQKGLVRAEHPQTGPAFTFYKNDTRDRQSLSNDFVTSVLDDPSQPERYLWVGTKGGGLERLDKKSGLFRHFTEAQGLPNKVVYGILPDESGDLWMSTNRGLAQFNPRTFVFRSYTKADGLQGDEFNTGSYFRTASGELLFGGVNGLTAFRPGEVARKEGPLPLAQIIGLKVNNESVEVGDSSGILPQSIEHTTRIRLAHDQNLVTLEFGLMDYANAAKNRFRYRLEGIDDDWVEAGTNRFANYAQLPYGSYTLHMMGSADGVIWSKPVELGIRVLPPFYRTWWAYLIYALAAIGVLWQLYRFQTQRWRLQQQLRFEHKEASRLAELDALKTQFFANISHEFRTPLTLIIGPAEEASREYAHDGRFPLIERNARRLLSLVNQLLDLSKLEAGQLRVDPEPGNLAAFLSMLASSFNSLAQSRQIRFIFTQDEPEYLAEFDRDKLEKIVTNLLANAFKFTPEGHEVRMTVRYSENEASGGVELTIEDTGIGIAPEHLEHIFERFYQVEGQSNRSYEGTGIGLALVYELVKVLGGTIQVRSEQGRGTSFTVVLPLTATGAEAGRPLPAFPTADSLLRPVEESALMANGQTTDSATDKILLIIDDNADIRAYVRSVFQSDYQIVEAVDGQDGLEKATALLPDIIICDLMMPRLDGFGFCKTLKTQEVTSHIPVIMLTAKATISDRIEGFELGADEYLTKPFDRAEIQARVRNLIRQRERLYHHFTSRSGQHPVEPEIESSPSPRIVAEQAFLDRLKTAVLDHMDDPGFGVEVLAEAVNLSRTQLHRKLKSLTGAPTSDFIRHIRLAKAEELLRTTDQTVTQIAYTVGFDNLSYFAKVFQEQYGVLPSLVGKSDSAPI